MQLRLFRRLFSSLRRPRQAGATRPSRPQLEPLEERSLLSANFAPPVSVTSGAGESSSFRLQETADFNNDGNPDLLIRLTKGSRVYLGNGDGAFRPISNPPLSGDAVLVADFNGDSKLDLLSGNADVHLGNGDGTFRSALHTDTLAGTYHVANLNDDGKPDLVISTFDAKVAVALGKGDGAFHRSQVMLQPLSNQDSFGNVIVADFNDDELSDAAIQSTSSARIVIGRGDGTFGPTTQILNNIVTYSLRTADFNEDGRADLVATTNESTFTVLLADGSGSFERKTYPLNFPSNVSPFDANFDGAMDLVQLYGNATSPGEVYLGNGDGTFQSAAPLSNDVRQLLTSNSLSADFNRDGKLDRARSDAFRLTIELNNGDGTFRTANTTIIGSTQSAAVVADFNGDRRDDLAIANQNGSVHILLSKTAGEFAVLPPIATDAGSRAIVAGDFNGDGRADLAVANGSAGTVSILIGRGDGAFSTTVNVHVTPTPISIAVGDVNGDGQQDLATLDNDLRLTVLLGRGDGSFTATPAPVVPQASADRPSVLLPDLNGDKRDDLLVVLPPTYFTGSTYVFLSQSDGGFAAPESSHLVGGVVRVADVNHDSVPDLVMGSRYIIARGGSAQVFVRLGNGDGTFRQPEQRIDAYVDSGAVADFDGDGEVDFVTAPGQTGNLQLFQGLSYARFRRPAPVPAGANQHHTILTGDFDGDGAADLFLVGADDNALLLNHPRSLAEQIVIALYRDLLSREPEEAGLAYWSAPLGDGRLTRAQLVQQIQAAPEYQGRVYDSVYTRLIGNYIFASTTGPSFTPRAAEVTLWKGILGQGGSREQLEIAILGSESYRELRESRSAAFLTAVYKDLLDRPLSSGEQQYWESILASGVARTDVAAAIRNSAEADRVAVQRAFDQFLYRQPEEAGAVYFVGQLRHGAAIEQVVTQLVSSAEYHQLVVGNSASTYVAGLYNRLLARPATSQDKTYWISLLSSGLLAPGQLALQLLSSAEYRVLFVGQHYATWLFRPADLGGMNHFVGLLAAGGTLSQVQQMLLGSEEYFATRGSSRSEFFLTSLYQDLLGRNPDARGQQSLLQALNQGASRAEAAAVLLNSAEYRTRLVRGLYRDFLGREAEEAGLNYWVHALGAGLRQEQLIAALVGSDDFLANLALATL